MATENEKDKAYLSSTFSQQNKEDFYPLCGLVTQKQFLKEFERMGMLGGGGEAAVYSVKNKTTRKSYALVLNQNLVTISEMDPTALLSKDDRKKLIEHLIENQKLNPFQGKIYSYFWMVNPNYPYFNEDGEEGKGIFPFQDVKEGYFLNNVYEDDPNATHYLHEAILMEQGEGDLTKSSYEDVRMDPMLEKLMFGLNNYSLSKASIISRDEKKRNYIFVKTDGQFYKGKRMDTYNFWCFIIESHLLYMPVPSHIIKRVDYGGWCISSSPTDQKKGSIVQTLAKRLALPEQEFIARFCSPPQDPNARILYIDMWRQKNV